MEIFLLRTGLTGAPGAQFQQLASDSKTFQDVLIAAVNFSGLLIT
jgi:hypothetical protein